MAKKKEKVQPEQAGKRPRLKIKDYVDAVIASRGNISLAGQMLGVSRTQVHKMALKHKAIADAVTEGREVLVDLAEAAIVKLIAPKEGQPNPQSVIFTLRTQGKKRGWVERTEITGAEGGPLEISPEDLDRKLARLADTLRSSEDSESAD